MFKKLRQKLRYRKVLRDCGCVIKCVECGDIQNDNAECKKLDANRYEYTCGKCKNVAIALFGVFPLPVWEFMVVQAQDKIAALPKKFAETNKPNSKE